jgi:hypothetical protein
MSGFRLLLRGRGASSCFAAILAGLAAMPDRPRAVAMTDSPAGCRGPSGSPNRKAAFWCGLDSWLTERKNEQRRQVFPTWATLFEQQEVIQ